MSAEISGVKKHANPTKIIIAFAAIYIIWGSTYLAIRFAVETIPPFLMAGIRFIISGAVLYAWCSYKKFRKPNLKEVKTASITGFMLLFIGNGVVVWAAQFVPSGLIAVLVAIMPMWMVIINWSFFDRLRPDKKTIMGVFIGVSGVILLSGMGKNVLLDSGSNGSSVFLYSVIITFGAVSWATGSLFARKNKTDLHILYSVGIQMLTGGVMLVLLGLFSGEWINFSVEKFSLLSILSVGYLITFGALIGYTAYCWLINNSPPSKVSTFSFVNPLIAVMLGYFLANESLNLQMILGAGAVLSSVLLIISPKDLKLKKHLARAKQFFFKTDKSKNIDKAA